MILNSDSHFKLKCHTAIDLKLGKFKAQDKGQMELYLRRLEKYKMIQGDNPTIGLILCSGSRSEPLEWMRLDKDNIRISGSSRYESFKRETSINIRESRKRYLLERLNGYIK